MWFYRLSERKRWMCREITPDLRLLVLWRVFTSVCSVRKPGLIVSLSAGSYRSDRWRFICEIYFSYWLLCIHCDWCYYITTITELFHNTQHTHTHCIQSKHVCTASRCQHSSVTILQSEPLYLSPVINQNTFTLEAKWHDNVLIFEKCIKMKWVHALSKKNYLSKG